MVHLDLGEFRLAKQTEEYNSANSLKGRTPNRLAVNRPPEERHQSRAELCRPAGHQTC